MAAACGGGASASPTAQAPAVATPAPAAASEDGNAGGGAAAAGEGMTLTIDGSTAEYTVTCTIDEGKSILVEGKHGADTAVFHWNPGTMPWVDGVTGGSSWKSGDLNASISFDSAHSWTFKGEIPTDDAAKTLEGKAICK
jgi:hypothetical protein